MIVIGAGPAGLCAAAALRHAGIDVLVIEQRADPAPGTRAIGVHAPVLAALEQLGVTERLLEHGIRIPRGIARAGGRTLGIVRFDRLRQRFPFALALPQAATEAALAAAAPTPEHGARALRMTEHASGVDVDVAVAGAVRTMRARAAVVASGAAGRALVSTRPRRCEHGDQYLMADVDDAAGEPDDAAVITLAPGGVVESFPLPAGRRRLVAWVGRGLPADGELATRLRDVVAERTGRPELAARITAAQGFTVRRVLLPSLQTARAVVIGDAAHEVSPIGGQGMNLGLLDAVALAPALADWLRTGDAAQLRAWERRRLASARTAARLAALNTGLGRPLPRVAHGALAGLVGLGLATPAERLARRAFSMGFDRDA